MQAIRSQRTSAEVARELSRAGEVAHRRARPVAAGGERERQRLLVENARLAGRLQRLGPALTSLAGDLARARRELALLRRENARLRSTGSEISEHALGAAKDRLARR